jgi:hypothetical protein
MGRLDQLNEAARGLHEVLVDPLLGGCEPCQDSELSLLLGDELTRGQVEDAVIAAASRAARDEAVLVVALLGHGFAAPHLYFMVGDSKAADPASAVNVPNLLAEVSNKPGVDGVIALIDTCHAGAATPDAMTLARGARSGHLRIDVVAAATALQNAKKMRFSFALAQTIRNGLPSAEATLCVKPLIKHLHPRVSGGQTIGYSGHDQDAYAAEDDLWLARNAAYSQRPAGDAFGQLAVKQLVDALATCKIAPARWTRDSLNSLIEQLGPKAEDAGADPIAYRRLTDLSAKLAECARTSDFLNRSVPQVLSDHRLRDAGKLAGFPPEVVNAPVLRDLLEHAVLRAQPYGAASWFGLTRFVSALAHLTGLPLSGDLLEWAQRLQVVAQVRSALDEFAQQQRRAGVRLVLGLDDAWGQWPEEVQAWLVRNTVIEGSEVFRCPSQDARGVGVAMALALRWARERLHLDERPLEYVDVAASAALLARWHPEEAVAGRNLLGVGHTVTLRWGGALYADREAGDDVGEFNDTAARVIQHMQKCGAGGPPQWLETTHLTDLDALHDKLLVTRIEAAFGADQRSQGWAEVLEFLLPYAPILLWPQENTRLPAERVRTIVNDHWHTLPLALAHAYRQRFTTPDGEVPELSEIRAVWHDQQWLDFCRQFEDRVVTAPQEAS